MLVLDNLNIFKYLLNKKLNAISTSHGRIYNDTIVGDKIDLNLHFEHFNLLFFCNVNLFFENDSGDAYYNFDIKLANSSSSYAHIKYFNSLIIEKIEIFSREIEISDFQEYPKIYNLIKPVKKTTDLFLFIFQNKTQMLITFHPFLTGLEANFTAKSISLFFNEYASIYKLEHEIE